MIYFWVGSMRILLYSHDTYGLGNIRRNLAIAHRLAHDFPSAVQLLLTGAMHAHSFKLPERLDYIKLPAITRGRSTVTYSSYVLPLPLATIIEMRKRIMFNAATSFKPDLLLVDKAPGGIKGELVETLTYVKQNHPHVKIVLCLRDILDESLRVRNLWTRENTYHILETLYDAILIFGERGIFDPIKEYQLTPSLAKKVIWCGYIGRFGEKMRAARTVRDELHMKKGHLVLVSAGGGGDGFNLFRAFLKMLSSHHTNNGSLNFHSLLITGPFLPASKRHLLSRFETQDLPLTIKEFTPDFASYLNAADLVLSMGGYNSVCESLSLGKKLIVVPRIKPRSEQLIRAMSLAHHRVLEMIHPHDLTPTHLLNKITACLQHNTLNNVKIDLRGAERASNAIGTLLRM